MTQGIFFLSNLCNQRARNLFVFVFCTHIFHMWRRFYSLHTTTINMRRC